MKHHASPSTPPHTEQTFFKNAFLFHKMKPYALRLLKPKTQNPELVLSLHHPSLLLQHCPLPVCPPHLPASSIASRCGKALLGPSPLIAYLPRTHQ